MRILCALLLLLATHPLTHSAAGARVMTPKPKITPFLWFDRNAEEAVRFYCSVFKDSKILGESRWGEGGPVPKGTLMTCTFRLGDLELIAFNGGATYKLNESISLFVHCESQAEVDETWTKLLAGGGEEGHCGWLKDRFGLAWQVIPTAMLEKIQDKDPAKAKRAVEAMLKMQKIDLEAIERAHAGR